MQLAPGGPSHTRTGGPETTQLPVGVQEGLRTIWFYRIPVPKGSIQKARTLDPHLKYLETLTVGAPPKHINYLDTVYALPNAMPNSENFTQISN